jgi:hypothetical protein
MDKDLEKQFELMKWHLKPEANVHNAVIEFTKLMKMFYEYLEQKKHEQ